LIYLYSKFFVKSISAATIHSAEVNLQKCDPTAEAHHATSASNLFAKSISAATVYPAEVTVRYDTDADPRPECHIRVETTTEFGVYLIQHYRPASEDPIAIWLDICLKYGFVNPGRNFLEISGHPTNHLVTYKYKIPTSLSKVAIPALSRRFFGIAIDDSEIWDTGEVLSVETWDKDNIWAQLTDLRPGLPHHSQFLFQHSTGEVPRLSLRLPLGPISVYRIKFPVTWRIEMCTDDIT
jgi:hypothetical protein